MFTISIVLQGIEIPFPMQLRDNNPSIWIFPYDYLDEINEIKAQISFNDAGIVDYFQGRKKPFGIRKKTILLSYLVIQDDFQDNINEIETEELIKIIWEKVKPTVICLEYLISSFKINLNQFWIFDSDNKFFRFINLNPYKQELVFHAKRHEILSAPIYIPLEDVLSQIIDKFYVFKDFLNEFELFKRGKLNLPFASVIPRKDHRDIMDILSDLWESMEHLSKKHLIMNHKKLSSKVDNFIDFCKNIDFPLSEDNLKLVKEEIYKRYNEKKHDSIKTVDYHQIIDAKALQEFTLLCEEIYLHLYEITPNILSTKNHSHPYLYSLYVKNDLKANQTPNIDEDDTFWKRSLRKLQKYSQFEPFIHFIRQNTLNNMLNLSHLKVFYESSDIILQDFEIDDLTIKYKAYDIDIERLSFKNPIIFEKFDILYKIQYKTYQGNIIPNNPREITLNCSYLDISLKDKDS